MGRNTTFIDRQFGGDDGDPGEFIPGLVGVAMPFEGTEWDDVFSAIKSECQKLGLRAQRVDEYVASGIVLKDIGELIENSEFLVIDLSLERQNVYYELGYAHGVGNDAKDILLIALKGTKLHYNVSGLRVHYYEGVDQLRTILARGLHAMIEARGH